MTNTEIESALNSMNLQTDRLVLKKFSTEDAMFNIEDEMDQNLMKYIRDPLSLDETTKKTMELVTPYVLDDDKWCLFSIRTKESNNYIGLVCLKALSVEDGLFEIGWRLRQEYHGKGFATEATKAAVKYIFESINAHKLIALADSENEASVNIMEKLGMVQEAHHKKHFKAENLFIVPLLYEMSYG